MNRVLLFFVFIIYFSFDISSQEINVELDRYISDYQYQKALDYISEQPESKELLFKKALCYRGLDNNTIAGNILLSLSLDYKDDIQIIRELANCYKAQMKWKDALLCYEKLMMLDPDNVYYLIQKAEMQFQSESYDLALASYKTLVEDQKFDNMIKRIGLCFERLNKPDSAVVYYAKAWGKDSTDSFSAVSLVNANLKIKTPTNISDAIKYSELYLLRDSTNNQMNLLNGLSYYMSGIDLYDKAIERFEKCYAEGDSSLILLRSMGIASYTLDYNEKAKPFLEKAYRLDTLNTNVLYCLANASNSLKEYESAKEYYDKLLNRTIPSPQILYIYYRGQAIAYEGSDMFEEAIESYKNALENASADQKMQLYYSIGTMYDYDLLKPDKALEYYLLYKDTLVAFLEKVKEQGEVMPDEIKSIGIKINRLDERIGRLQNNKAKNKQPKTSS